MTVQEFAQQHNLGVRRDSVGDTTTKLRSETLQIIQQRMLRRRRSGGSKWSDGEFAELAALYLKWFRKAEK